MRQIDSDRKNEIYRNKSSQTLELPKNIQYDIALGPIKIEMWNTKKYIKTYWSKIKLVNPKP